MRMMSSSPEIAAGLDLDQFECKKPARRHQSGHCLWSNASEWENAENCNSLLAGNFTGILSVLERSQSLELAEQPLCQPFSYKIHQEFFREKSVLNREHFSGSWDNGSPDRDHGHLLMRREYGPFRKT